MGILRTRNIMGDKRLSHQVGAVDPEEKAKTATATVPCPPSFYDNYVDNFMKKKSNARNLLSKENSKSTSVKIKLNSECLKQNYYQVSCIFILLVLDSTFA